MQENIYEEYGCKNRQEYLEQVADNSGVDMFFVQAAADMLGPNEDFDGLVTTINEVIK